MRPFKAVRGKVPCGPQYIIENNRDLLMLSNRRFLPHSLHRYQRVLIAVLAPLLHIAEEWSRLYHAADVLGQAPLYIDDTPALSPLELRARTRRLKAESGVGLAMVDYLQLMRGSKRTDSREQEISEISRSLKGLAKEMDIPVVALSQLNRKLEERTDKRPLLSDLRESGAIEQDADVIMFIYRDEVYHKQPDNPHKGSAEIIIGKQRNGPIGTATLAYLGSYTAFEDLEPGLSPQPSEAGGE